MPLYRFSCIYLLVGAANFVAVVEIAFANFVGSHCKIVVVAVAGHIESSEVAVEKEAGKSETVELEAVMLG